LLESFVAYPATTARFLGGDAPFRVVQGHPYLNATVFRHLAFKWPGFPPPRFMLEFFPPDEAEAWVRRAAAPPDLRVYASILTTTLVEQRWKRFRWNPFTNHLAWRDYANSLDGRLAALEQAPPAAAIEVVVPILRDYVKVHITSLLFANLWWQWTEGHLDDEQARVLLQPGAGSITARINAELRALDRASLPAFLQRHGHRSDASWELWSTRWHEVPETVLAMAEMARSAPPPPPQADVEARIRGLGPVLSRAVRLTRAYLVLREEQRWHLDRIFDRLKARLLLLGRELFPDEPEAIRFLRVEELSLPPPMRSVVLGRRRDEQPMSNPPDFLRGDEAIPLPSRASARIQGLGISPGVVSGRVRVLLSPAQGAELAPGEILVTRSTDPEWTSLFARAGGMILELGSMLSHGAVVAREYRVPAVANIRGATQILTTGMEVTLDGRSGAVWVAVRAPTEATRPRGEVPSPE
jgi:phosphohistidine swiveling domain-containing protein